MFFTRSSVQTTHRSECPSLQLLFSASVSNTWYLLNKLKELLCFQTSDFLTLLNFYNHKNTTKHSRGKKDSFKGSKKKQHHIEKYRDSINTSSVCDIPVSVYFQRFSPACWNMTMVCGVVWTGRERVLLHRAVGPARHAVTSSGVGKPQTLRRRFKTKHEISFMKTLTPYTAHQVPRQSAQ